MGADILKTLTNLSDGLGSIKGRTVRRWGRGRRKKDEILRDAGLQVGIRTGDVPQNERRRMLIDPPDLLVITPENLLLMLCSKARETLDSVGWIIVDEVHEMIPSKRGALLALTLEMLSDMVCRNTGREPVRIGLSATVRPETTAAKYLGGMYQKGRPRPVRIIKEDPGKQMVIEFRTLIEGTHKETDHQEKVLDDIGAMLEKGGGPIVVFHNTRRAAEKMAYYLVRRGFDNVMPHHGSLGADIRKKAEEGLKNGDLKAIISSTSLELGIDIGDVRTVCQISSPKDPSKMIQRFGRSGHGLGRTSHGLIYPEDGVDLLEALAVSTAAARGDLQKLSAPRAPMDVLAQFVIGMSLVDGGTTEDRVWKLSRRAYSFRSLKRSSLRAILQMLSERLQGPDQPSARLWYDERKRAYLPRRNTGQAFYLNCGTIPRETSYRVIDERTKRAIGDLSRDFGETLYERDVILLGSKPHRITGFTGSKILVHEDLEARPTVPSWSGEIMPRADIVANELMKLYTKGCERSFRHSTGVRIDLDKNGRSICRSVIKELTDLDLLPAPQRLPVESCRLKGSQRLYIFLTPGGRKMTETLGRVLAYGLRRSIGARIDYVATDDGFAVISPKELSRMEMISAMGGEDFERVARGLILTSSIFRSRFTHCLNRSLLVLSKFRGKDTGVMYRKKRVERLLGLVMGSWYSEEGWEGARGPLRGLISLADEALKEVFLERIDIGRCSKMIQDLQRGSVSLDIVEMQDGPSILGMSIIGPWKGSIRNLRDDMENVERTYGSPVRSEEPGQFAPVPIGPGHFHDARMRVMKILSACGEACGLKNGSETGIPEGSPLEGEIRLSMGGMTFGKSDIEGLPPAPFDISSIPEFRRSRMSRPGDLGRVIGWMPFFTHPIEVLGRSRSVGYNDIRSSMKSGRIVPVWIAGGDRSCDRGWAMLFRNMADPNGCEELGSIPGSKDNIQYSRADLREILETAGEDLTTFINMASERKILGRFPAPARDMIGDQQSNYIMVPCDDKCGAGENKGGLELERFLRFFGPFDVSELLFIFGTTIMHHVSAGIGGGMLNYGVGRPGPLSENSGAPGTDLGLWLWSPKNHKEVLSWSENRRGNTEGVRVQTSTDPSTVLTGKWKVWIDKERVRGAISVIVMAFRNEDMIGHAHVIETQDLVRISDLEVVDFDIIVDVSDALVKFLDDYERLGFRAFLIERIMGIPAGEAARASVEVFLQHGYNIESTPKGPVLIRGAELLRGISREDILYNMFKAQGMIEGHRWSHPLEVISKLGSVVDRWEFLSRIGSARYRRLSVTGSKELEEMNVSEWKRSSENVDPENDGPAWSDKITPWGLGLSDMKDLARRFSLVRGTMDQPYPVWSLPMEFERYPPPSRCSIGSMPPEMKRFLSTMVRMTPSDTAAYIRARGSFKEAEEMLRRGFVVEGPWGEIRNDIIKLPGHKRDQTGKNAP
ncbi:MAG: DEAD/DEAH box helicase, partial [Candidatus Thermoplasmatota archaeon]|nr:DEAD/DEAH box helicase [Candidatus Thermoplasmatota archaeon]